MLQKSATKKSATKKSATKKCRKKVLLKKCYQKVPPELMYQNKVLNILFHSGDYPKQMFEVIYSICHQSLPSFRQNICQTIHPTILPTILPTIRQTICQTIRQTIRQIIRQTIRQTIRQSTSGWGIQLVSCTDAWILKQHLKERACVFPSMP